MKEKQMKEQSVVLLEELESEGKAIAKCRKEIINMINSGNKINCSSLILLCRQLNHHIDTFDKIDALLSYYEDPDSSHLKLMVSGQ